LALSCFVGKSELPASVLHENISRICNSVKPQCVEKDKISGHSPQQSSRGTVENRNEAQGSQYAGHGWNI
jgi:hypothetical protein